jgi:glutamate-1-semialdehyde 2,1-aminomutase
MREHSVHDHVWQLGGLLQGALREIASRHPSLAIRIGGMPSAPSLTFQLGELSASAKALCVRGMLARGFLFSSQLYVMWPHTEAHVGALTEALDSVLGEISRLHESGSLREEAGVAEISTGFARLV